MANEKRLIDANTLKAKAFADPDSGEAMVYLQDIDEARTVDAVEVVPGRWIAVDEWMVDECSNCGARINIEEFDDCSYHPKYGNVRLNYCPNCGARMDGGTYDGTP